MSEVLLQENLALKSEVSLLKTQVESLSKLLVTMKREKFGRKSERVIHDGTIQGNLLDLLKEEDKAFFNEAEAIASLNKEEKKEIEIGAHKRKQKKKIPLSELPVDEVRIKDLPENEKICPVHGSPLQKVGEKEVTKLEIIPESRKVIKEVTPIYGPCSDFCGEEERSKRSFDLLPETMATPSLLAYLFILKFDFALPFYRIERMWERLGIEITRATMARWTISVAEQLRPLINLMIEDLMIQGYLQCDETSVNALKVNGERFPSKSYIWVRYSPVFPIVIYEFHSTRSGKVPMSFFEDYSGYLQVDGYAGYNVISQFKSITPVACWNHTRTGFFKSYKDEKSALALTPLKMIRDLFKVEVEASKLQLNFDQRKELRLEKSQPILENFKSWLDQYKGQVVPSSYLGKAIDYALPRWDKLNVFLQDGRIELSTNLVENKIRPFTVGRKNWLFFDTDLGATAGCTHYSLIETAKSHGKNPQKYLEHVFEELPKCNTLEDLEKLLPYDRSVLLKKLEEQKPPLPAIDIKQNMPPPKNLKQPPSLILPSIPSG